MEKNEERRRRKSVDKETEQEFQHPLSQQHSELQNDFKFQIWFENELS